MEKLTLRQFADVVKALIEAGLSKENKKYNQKSRKHQTQERMKASVLS